MVETVMALSMLTEAGRTPAWRGDDQPLWWLHQIVFEHRVVGDIGFHGPPAAAGPATVEIGYNVVAGMRGRGVASHACAMMLAQAWRNGAEVVTAETERDNLASQRVLLRCGFVLEGFADPAQGDWAGSLRYVIGRPHAGTDLASDRGFSCES